jgi:GNAT superfamily N-acetyltransferase
MSDSYDAVKIVSLSNPSSSEYVDSVTKIFNETLGEKYVTSEQVFGYIQNLDTHIVLALYDGEAVGVSVAKIFHSLPDVGHFSPEMVSNFVHNIFDYSLEFPAIMLKHIVVSPIMQKRNVGTKLLQRTLQWAVRQNSYIIFVLGWKDYTGCHVEPLLMKNGFHNEGEFKNFWHEDSIVQQYFCPTCGNPCECSAVLFTRL